MKLIMSTLLPCICITNSSRLSTDAVICRVKDKGNLEKPMFLSWIRAAGLRCVVILRNNLVQKLCNVPCSQYHQGISEVSWTLSQALELGVHTPVKQRSKLYLME